MPAAIAKRIPRSAARFTAVSILDEYLPPRLMFKTAFDLSMPLLSITLMAWSIAPKMEDHDPEPASFKTFKEITSAPGATPTTPLPFASAAIVPAIWDPWPFTSVRGSFPLIQLRDQALFRFRSPVVADTPVSTTNA